MLLSLGVHVGLAEGAFAVGPASASASTASVSQSSLIANGISTSLITVQLKDASGANLTTGGATVTFILSASNGSIGSTTDVGNGTYRATYTSGTTTGLIMVTPRLSGVSFIGGYRPTITLTAGPASRAAITTGPSPSVNSGSVLPTQPVIRIVDANGNTVTSSTVDVVASIASSTSNGTLGGATTVRAVAGVATFTNLVISGIAGIHTLRFTPTSLTSVVSGEITTFSAAASVLVLKTTASGAINGEAFSTQPQITIQDTYSNAVNSSAIVTATISAGATLIGTTTATAYLGVATFSNLGVIGSPGSSYTITYTITAPTTITTTQSISPAAATQAGLTSLTINLGTMSPVFNTDTTTYRVSVSSSVSSILFTPTFTSAFATGSLNGSAFTNGVAQTYIPVNGTNDPFDIVVTAQDGITSKTYQVTVTKVITTVITTSTKPTSPTPTPTPSPTKSTTQPIKVPTVSLVPKITSLSTTSGGVGSSVTINGANLLTATSVRLSGKTAAIVSALDTELVVIVPAGAASGVFSLLTPKGSASSARFTVTP